MAAIANPEVLLLDGETLSPESLVKLSTGTVKIDLKDSCWESIKRSQEYIDSVVAAGKPVYGINTGFGNFATVSIAADRVEDLQRNLITSHSAGVGAILSLDRTRMLLALRINVLAKGYSGIRIATLKFMINAFNLSLLSQVPEQGTVGASGDLAPLSHLALGFLGIGKLWNPLQNRYDDAAEVLKQHGLEPLKLGPKEGLAMINGTQFMTSLGAEALIRAERIAKVADVTAALTLEAVMGTPRAFDPRIHEARPHGGQMLVAKRMRSLLHRPDNVSEIYESHANCGRVQDAYTLRCIPQVHGISNDTMAFVRSILQVELNSATDNPMVFGETGEIISGGNFHGEYVAKALDYLAIGTHELASMSERRIERLINSNLSGLPAFLVKEGGLNSGFMIAHCTAAALVSENKVLCHPSSVDSLPTSAGKEDHVSMGGMSARKALKVVENVEYVVAIELLAACQALEFQRPLKTTAPLEKVHEVVRSVVKPWDQDRFMSPDIEAVKTLISSGKILDAVAGYV